jgi:hypothetical protein
MKSQIQCDAVKARFQPSDLPEFNVAGGRDRSETIGVTQRTLGGVQLAKESALTETDTPPAVTGFHLTTAM